MSPLSAFVGHSFLERDKVVVTAILGVLDAISSLMPEFSWDHAEPAELKELSLKVKEKMEGKQLFIGICTPKELAADPEKLRHRWFTSSTYLSVDSRDVETKTSDWLLQEIGMAFGKNMKVIVLLEQGVRRPGGLQGDIEYISFERSRPELFLGKLTEMLRSVAPGSAMVSQPAETPPPSESSQPGASGKEFLTPDVSWNQIDYVVGIRMAGYMDDETAAEAINEAFKRSPLAGDDGNVAEFEAEVILSTKDRADLVGLLQELHRRYPTQSAPVAAIARAHERFSDLSTAAAHFERSAALATNPVKQLHALSKAALNYARDQRATDARIALTKCASIVRDHSELEAAGMDFLAETWLELKQYPMFFACSERCLQIEPTRDTRFRVAHTYSDKDLPEHALFHYRQYVKAHDNAAGWNNLGVSAAHLKLPVTAISAYQRASDDGNTLATSNIAFAYLKAGFAERAKEECEKKLSPDAVARLHEALSSAKEAIGKEEEQERELLAGTSNRRTFAARMGRASIDVQPTTIAPAWSGPKCKLDVGIAGNQLRMRGTYTRPSSLLGNALGGTGVDVKLVSLEFEGELVGRAVFGRFREESSPRGFGALSILDEEWRNFVGIIHESGESIEIIEERSGAKVNAYIINVVA